MTDTDDGRLDRLLTASAPAPAPRSTALRDAVVDLADAMEPESRPRRRWARAGVASLAIGLVFGAGAAAQALGFISIPTSESWDVEPEDIQVTVTLTDGSSCEVTYSTRPYPWSDTADDPATWQRVWDVVSEVHRTTDPAMLNTSEIRSRYRTSVRVAEAEMAQRFNDEPDELAPPMVENEIITGAPGAELRARINAELVERRLPTDLVVMVSTNSCDLGPVE